MTWAGPILGRMGARTCRPPTSMASSQTVSGAVTACPHAPMPILPHRWPHRRRYQVPSPRAPMPHAHAPLMVRACLCPLCVWAAEATHSRAAEATHSRAAVQCLLSASHIFPCRLPRPFSSFECLAAVVCLADMPACHTAAKVHAMDFSGLNLYTVARCPPDRPLSHPDGLHGRRGKVPSDTNTSQPRWAGPRHADEPGDCAQASRVPLKHTS